MTLDETRKLLTCYDGWLADYEPMEFLERHYDGGLHITGARLQMHLRWMVQQCLFRFAEPGPDFDLQRTHRWIGYVQGELRALKKYTVSELRGHVRACHNADPCPGAQSPGNVGNGAGDWAKLVPGVPVTTQRDQFAMAALTGLLARPGNDDADEITFAKMAYRVADAMVLVRDIPPGKPKT